MQNKLGKYKIGLAIIGVFALGIVVMVVVQAGTTKQDNDTYKQASKIATKLESYVSSHDRIPESLTQIGGPAAPSSVTYHKLSEAKYEFCVTYKADSSGFDATSLGTDLATTALTGIPSGYSGSSSSDTPESSYLYLNSTHHKGKNCQTIKPYIYNTSSSYDLNSIDSSSSDYNY